MQQQQQQPLMHPGGRPKQQQQQRLLRSSITTRAFPPLAMVNVDFASPSLVLGVTLIGCGVALLQVRGRGESGRARERLMLADIRKAVLS